MKEIEDDKQYEKDCEAIRKGNRKLLGEFEAALTSSGLGKKTVENHSSNIDFYINEYLLYEEATEAETGVLEVGEFMGYWFIKKAMWASQSTMRSNATSLKKFYGFLHEKGLVEKKELDDLKQTIKEGMPEWLATLARYNDPYVDVWQ